jgi:hypothetical protein
MWPVGFPSDNIGEQLEWLDGLSRSEGYVLTVEDRDSLSRDLRSMHEVGQRIRDLEMNILDATLDPLAPFIWIKRQRRE